MKKKQYYSSNEVDNMIQESILKNAQEVAFEVKHKSLQNKKLKSV